MEITPEMQAAFDEGFREGLSASLGERIRRREKEDSSKPIVAIHDPLPTPKRGDANFYEICALIDEVLGREGNG